MLHLKKNILLIDNDPDLLAIYTDTLEKKGFQVAVACASTCGLELAPNIEPDLIIADVGFDLLDKLRTLQKFERTPIIILTSGNEKTNLIGQIGANESRVPVSEYLTEYISPEELVEHAKRYLN